MKHLLSVLVLLVLAIQVEGKKHKQKHHGNAVETISHLDLDRYLGTWYQIAAIPASFQKKCTGNTSAVYTKTDDGHIGVENSCTLGDGTRNVALGQARVNPQYNETSKLQVTFVNIMGKWVYTFGGDYWVMYINDDYTHVIVGHPKREFLWILARETSLPRSALKEYEDIIEDEDYDTCQVIITQEGYLNNMQLCHLA